MYLLFYRISRPKIHHIARPKIHPKMVNLLTGGLVTRAQARQDLGPKVASSNGILIAPLADWLIFIKNLLSEILIDISHGLDR